MTDLHDAALAGDVERCAGASAALVGQADERGLTPLHLAAFAGHAECVRVLLEREAKVAAVTTEILSSVTEFWARQRTVFLQPSALDLGATILIDKKATPLHLAAHAGHLAVVTKLLAAGARPSVKTAGGVTPLHCAAQAASLPVVQALLAAKASIDATVQGQAVVGFYDAGMTPLHAAAQRGAANVVAALLAAGADPNARTKRACSSLYFASVASSAETVALLARYGARQEVADLDSGNDPLREAILRGAEACFEALLAAGVSVHGVVAGSNADLDPRLVSVSRDAPIVLATRHRRMRMMASLSAAGAESPRYATFYSALRYGDYEEVCRRLEAGEDPRDGMPPHASPLDCAVSGCLPEIVEALLAAGEDPNAEPPAMSSALRSLPPLHRAALAFAEDSHPVARELQRAASLRIARALLGAGADPQARDHHGNSALWEVRGTQHPEMKQLLLQAGAPLARLD